MIEQNIKYSTYLPEEVIEAVKRFAAHKKVPASLVIEQAITKCVPERFFSDPYKAS